MIDLAGPAQIGDVDHSVDAILEFHERAVSGHVANLALDRLPMVNFFSISSHGLGSSWRKPSEIFCSSLFTPSTTASTSWPTLRISAGRMMRFVQDSSET